jgi:hypothetical protein
VKALLNILAALLALAVLAAALRVAVVVLAIIVLVALIVDPLGTLKRLGAAAIMLILWLSPVTALLLIIAVILAALVTHLVRDR